MMVDEILWRYYNHALIPMCEPHVNPTDKPKFKWKFRGPLLARWTSDFDMSKEAPWWYIIKDSPFDIMAVNAKRRYEIKKGLGYFEVRRINPADYAENLFKVQAEALSAYPAKYRPNLNREQFIKACGNWHGVTFGAFSREDENLVAYAHLVEGERAIKFSVQKSKPAYEKKAVNAALVYGILEYYKSQLASGMYIVDGERTIVHETGFQDYLEKYFQFRKAYAKLNICYKPGIGMLVALLYRFRRLLKVFDNVGVIHQINGVLKMEEIVQMQKNQEYSC